MIENPFETREIVFFDWDNEPIGILHIPKVMDDARVIVNFFVGVNFVHPDLQYKIVDNWAMERKEKREKAYRDWPRNKVYPEESWYLVMGKNGLEVKHSLHYRPGRAMSSKGRMGGSFRPIKMIKKDGE